MASGGPGGSAGWARRHRAPLLAGAVVAAASGYLAYRAYHSERLASTQAALARAAETLQRLAGAAGAAGAALELVASDLRAFLASDADEVPRSLRQLAKLAAAPEVQDAIAACAGAAARGAAGPATEAALALADRLLEAVLSERGSSLVALAVSVAAREGTSSLVGALREAVLGALAGAPGGGGATGPRSRLAPGAVPPLATAAADALAQQVQAAQQQAQAQQQPQARAPPPQQRPPAAGPAPLADAAGSAVLGALALLQSPRGERLMRTVISSGVGSAVGACMDQAASHDLYGPLFAAFARSEHRGALTELAASMSGACTREMMNIVTRVPPGLGGRAAARAAAAAAGGAPRLADSAFKGAPALAAAASSSGEESGGEGAASGSAASPARSAPSSPQSGPSTPEPSLAGAPLAPRRAGRDAAALTLRLPRALQHAHARSAPQLGAGAPAGAGAGAPALAVPLEAGPVAWVVAFFVHATRHPEIRSLVLEMSCSSTREFVRTLLPFSWTGGRGGARGRDGDAADAGAGWLERQAGAEAALRAQVHRLQVTLSVLCMLALYAMSPVAMLPGLSA
jgi:hypothetical protein